MNILKLPLRVYRYIKKKNFVREFKYCAKSTGFGIMGYGDGCDFKGKRHISIGENGWIGTGSEIYVYDTHYSQNLNAQLNIGDNVRITARCRITCAGNITIGNDVLIAPDVFITDHNHGMDPENTFGYNVQPLCIKDVNIKNGVWIGQRVCILPGVTIGEKSIIGANSVVTHDIPECCIAAGNPAKVIKKWNSAKKSWEKIK